MAIEGFLIKPQGEDVHNFSAQLKEHLKTEMEYDIHLLDVPPFLSEEDEMYFALSTVLTKQQALSTSKEDPFIYAAFIKSPSKFKLTAIEDLRDTKWFYKGLEEIDTNFSKLKTEKPSLYVMYIPDDTRAEYGDDQHKANCNYYGLDGKGKMFNPFTKVTGNYSEYGEDREFVFKNVPEQDGHKFSWRVNTVGGFFNKHNSNEWFSGPITPQFLSTNFDNTTLTTKSIQFKNYKYFKPDEPQFTVTKYYYDTGDTFTKQEYDVSATFKAAIPVLNGDDDEVGSIDMTFTGTTKKVWGKTFSDSSSYFSQDLAKILSRDKLEEKTATLYLSDLKKILTDNDLYTLKYNACGGRQDWMERAKLESAKATIKLTCANKQVEWYIERDSDYEDSALKATAKGAVHATEISDYWGNTFKLRTAYECNGTVPVGACIVCQPSTFYAKCELKVGNVYMTVKSSLEGCYKPVKRTLIKNKNGYSFILPYSCAANINKRWADLAIVSIATPKRRSNSHFHFIGNYEIEDFSPGSELISSGHLFLLKDIKTEINYLDFYDKSI